MKNKYVKKVIVVAVSAFMAVSAIACGTDPTKSEESSKETEASTENEFPEKIKIGYQPVANDMMIAITEGLLDNLGYPYELVEFNSGNDINNALASGSIDVGYIGTVPVVSGIANGIGYQVFWIDGIITECEGLVVKDGISDIKDLEGKTVGVVTGSTSHYSLVSAIKNAGISEDSVTIVNGKPAELTAMWERGDIDAAYTWQPSLEAMINDGGTVIFDGTDSEEIGATTAVEHVVNKDFAEKYPKAVSALVDVLASTQEVYNADPDKVSADVADKLEMDVDMCKTSIEGYRWLTKEEQASEEYLGGAYVDVLKNTADFLESQGSLPTIPDDSEFEASITAEFVK